MPGFARDRAPLDELSDELQAIAKLVQGWPTTGPGSAHVQIIDLRDRFRLIRQSLDAAAAGGHDLGHALAPMAANLRGAADDLYRGTGKAPSKARKGSAKGGTTGRSKKSPAKVSTKRPSKAPSKTRRR
jgi:hypothetical protein